jgi:hypothetical protein
MTTMFGRPAALATMPFGEVSFFDEAVGSKAVSLTQLAGVSPRMVATVSRWNRIILQPDAVNDDCREHVRLGYWLI